VEQLVMADTISREEITRKQVPKLFHVEQFGLAVQAIASLGNAASIVPRRENVPRGTI
jgi:hypothetical protein